MKFCKYCGRQIGDNEICSCPDAQAEAQQAAAQQPVYEGTPAQQPIAPQEAQSQAPEQPMHQNVQQEPINQPYESEETQVLEQPPFQQQPTPDLNENPAAVFNQPPQQQEAPVNHNQPVAPPQQPYYAPQGQPYDPYGQQAYGQPAYGQPAYGQPPYGQPYNNGQYVPQSVKPAPSSVDFSKFTHFFKNYFVNPNEAVNEHAKAKDAVTLIILSVLFVLMCGLCDLGLGLNIGYKAGAFFVFGLVFGIIGLAMSFGSNILYTTLTKQKQDIVELIGKTILHTPMTTILLFLGIFVSLVKSPVFIAIYYVIIAITFAVSQISILIDYTKTQGTSMLKKLYFFGVVFIFVAVMAILAYLQCKTVISSLIDSYLGSWF